MKKWWNELPISDSVKHQMLVIARLLFVCGLLLLILWMATLPIRITQEDSEKQAYYQELIPTGVQFKPFDPKHPSHNQVLVSALDNKNHFIGYIISSSGNGYGGPIHMLIGMAGNKITGIRILSHYETEGVGAQFTDPALMSDRPFSFLGQFVGKNIFDAFKPGEDIVAVTGATHTSEAVGDGIRKAIKVYRKLEHIIE